MTGQTPPASERFMYSAYQDWASRQGIPIYEDFSLNLFELDLAPWAPMGVDAALAHVEGRGDWVSTMVLQLEAGQATEPFKHLYEAVYFILSGRGVTTIEFPDGTTRDIAWGEKSLFSVPLNLRYRIKNQSASDPARIAVMMSAPVLMNLFHTSDDFIFNNAAQFPERWGPDRYFNGEGKLIERTSGRHLWESNLIPDLTNFELPDWKERGAGGTHQKFMLADITMQTHVSEMPMGRYKKAHRHAAGAHIFQVTGYGYTLLWYEGEQDYRRVPWEHGWIYAPPEWMFHQHFNTSPGPARYLAVIFGNVRYPFWSSKKEQVLKGDVSIKQGGRQIEYEDENPRIFEMFNEECVRNGAAVDMPQFIDRL